MTVNSVFVFKSIDAKKQNPNNSHFTTRFIPEMIL